MTIIALIFLSNLSYCFSHKSFQGFRMWENNLKKPT
jgi:hypothetical protein